jgi:thioesterase domain-containing protein
MQLCSQIEKVFGERLTPTVLLQAPTVEQLAGILDGNRRPTPASSLVALQPSGSNPPFFWVHGENSNAFLPRYLGPDQPLYGLVQQSRDGRPARHTRLEDIAAYYLREMRQVQPEGPYFLGGFCVGGTLAFEMAQQLWRRGTEVALLVLLDPPGRRSKTSSRAHGSTASGVTPVRSGFRGSGLSRVTMLAGDKALEQLAHLGNEVSRRVADAAKNVACRAYVLAGRPIPHWLRTFYINAVYHRARRHYVPRVYPGHVVVLTTEGPGDPRIVWEELAAGGLEIRQIPGRHTEIVFERSQIQGLATHLKACLDRAHQKQAVHVEGRSGSGREPTLPAPVAEELTNAGR